MTSSFLKPSEFLTLPTFGLDISSSSIKLVKFKRRPVGLVPQVIDELPITETCALFSGNESDKECDEVVKGLLHLKKKHKIEFVKVSIPEEKTYVFRAMVPEDALHSIDEFILFNLDQYVPIESQEAIFDYKILSGRDEEGKVPVVVTVIPKFIIEYYTELIESCGITIVAYEPETHAIARSVIAKGDKSPYIIINIDREVTTVSVVEEGLVQYTQTLSFGGYPGSGADSSAALSMLKESIQKVIIYWFTSRDQKDQGHKIENIIITGEGTRQEGLINFLESNLSVNATFGNVWRNCFDLNEYIPDIHKWDSLKYTTCVGLCLSRLK